MLRTSNGSSKSRLPTLLFRSLRSSARSWKSGPDDAFSGKKRPSMTCASVPIPDSTGMVTSCKRSREQRDDCPTSSSTPGHAFEREPLSVGTPTVTCYQCSVCRFISPTLELLKEHLLLHDEQHSDLILMCSECQFTSNHQEELVTHVRLHLEEGNHTRHIPDEQGIASARSVHQRLAVLKASNLESEMSSTPKKWYSFEHGRYRCLICNYECRQQRNLKTHAWKHASLVDCSYPIFEDEQTVLVPYKAPVLIWFQQVKRIT